MKLSFVKLVSSSYDPRTNAKHPMHGVTDFDAANGYEMELRDGYVTIAHSGRTALYSLGRVDYSLMAQAQAATQPTPIRRPVLTVAQAATIPWGAAVECDVVVTAEPTTDAVIADRLAERAELEASDSLLATADEVFASIAAEADAARAALEPPDMTPAEVIASIASVAPEVQRKKKRRR